MICANRPRTCYLSAITIGVPVIALGGLAIKAGPIFKLVEAFDLEIRAENHLSCEIVNARFLKLRLKKKMACWKKR